MWHKKGGDLPSGRIKLENFNKALHIANISEEDSGEYFCLASNKVGISRHSILVKVKGMSRLLCLLILQQLVIQSKPVKYRKSFWGQCDHMIGTWYQNASWITNYCFEHKPAYLYSAKWRKAWNCNCSLGAVNWGTARQERTEATTT